MTQPLLLSPDTRGGGIRNDVFWGAGSQSFEGHAFSTTSFDFLPATLFNAWSPW